MSSVLERIRTESVFRAPTFSRLASEHVKFDELVGSERVEHVLRRTVNAQESAFVLGPRGGGKSSVLAWLADNLPNTHFAVRVPVAGMDDAADPGVAASVLIAQTVDATSAENIKLEKHQRTTLARGRADEVTTTQGGSKLNPKLGGGPVPIELSAELAGVQKTWTQRTLLIDRINMLDQVVGVMNSHGFVPVFILEDTEAALGTHAPPEQIDRFFRGTVSMLINEVDAPTLIAVQEHYSTNPEFKRVSASAITISVPRLGENILDALTKIIDRRLEHYGFPERTGDIISDDALPYLAGFYDETGGSIRDVMQALDAAVGEAFEAGLSSAEVGHVRKGIADQRA